MNSWLSISFLHSDPNFSLFKTIKNQLASFNFYFLQAYQPYPHLTYIVECEEQAFLQLLSKDIKIIRALNDYDGSHPTLLLSTKNNNAPFWGGEKGLSLFHEQQKENSKLMLQLFDSKSENISAWKIKEAIHIQLIHLATSQLGKLFRLQFMEQFARYYFQVAFGDRQEYDILSKEYEAHFQSQKTILLHNAAIILDVIQQKEPDQDFLYTDYILYIKNYSRASRDFVKELNVSASYDPMQVAYRLHDGMCHMCNNRLQIDLRDEAMVLYFVKRILEELNFEDPLPLTID